MILGITQVLVAAAITIAVMRVTGAPDAWYEWLAWLAGFCGAYFASLAIWRRK